MDFESAGATLCTISPQLPEHARDMARKNGVEFPLLQDAGNEVAASYGLRHSIADDLKQVYLGFGIDLASYNGDDSWTLPMPARLIVDPEGVVRDVDADPDYTTRPEPDDTLRKLREMQLAARGPLT